MTLIRRAQPADFTAIAAFHLRVWRLTYQGIAPPEALRILDLHHREKQWLATLSRSGADRGVWIAESDGRIEGLAACCAPSSDIFGTCGEVSSLYIDPVRHGQGLGRRMLSQGMIFLRDAGFSGAALAVVRQNHPARAFYRHLGGIETTHFTDPGPVWPSQNILVTWPDGLLPPR